jgi:phosphatidylglycerol:prolipoprotein diacylglycerol transferase
MQLLENIPFINLYLPALVMVAILLVVSGLRLKYPVTLTATIVSFLMTLFIVGMKLFSFPIYEWDSVLYGKMQPGIQAIYLPGGLIFAGLGLLFLKFILKLKGSLLDTVIWGLPVAGFFQRTACLLNGCCYGKVTDLPWSIHYPVDSGAWNHHFGQGLIAENSTASLGVHPTQAYYMIGYLLALLFLLTIRKRIQKPGILALTGFMFLGGLRFIIEFFREPDPGKWFYVNLLGMNGLQWVLLISLLIACFYLVRNWKTIGHKDQGTSEIKVFPLKNAALLLFSALLIWNARPVLIFPEYVLLLTLVSGTVLLFVAELFSKGMSHRFRLQMASVLLGTLLTMSQAIPDTTIVLHPDTLAKQWLSLDAGFAGGQYNRVTYSCSGEETSRQKSAYFNGSTGFAFHHLTPKRNHLEAGFRLSAMDDYTLEGLQERYSRQVLLPYFKADFKWIGFGVGYAFVSDRQFGSLPMSSLRIGKRDKLFFESSLMNYYSTQALPGLWQVGLGYGFGQLDRNLLRFGITSVEGKLVGYLGGRYELNDRFGITSNLGLGNTIHASVGLQYRFHLHDVRQIP